MSNEHNHSLSPRHVFGVNVNTSSNLHFIDGSTVLYSCSNFLVLYNVESREQQLIPINPPSTRSSQLTGCDLPISSASLSQTEGLTDDTTDSIRQTEESIEPPKESNEISIETICLSSDGVWVAVSIAFPSSTPKQLSRKPPCVIVFHLQTAKRHKILYFSSTESADYKPKRFVSIAFSADAKFLLAQSAEPDGTLVGWQWAKSKQVFAVKILTSTTDAIDTKLSGRVAPRPVASSPKNARGVQPSTRTTTALSNAHHLPANENDVGGTNSPTILSMLLGRPNAQNSALICIIGSRLLKFARFAPEQTTMVKLTPTTRPEWRHFTCQCWFEVDRLAVGTNDGRILLFDGVELVVECLVFPSLVTSVTSPRRNSQAPSANLMRSTSRGNSSARSQLLSVPHSSGNRGRSGSFQVAANLVPSKDAPDLDIKDAGVAVTCLVRTDAGFLVGSGCLQVSYWELNSEWRRAGLTADLGPMEKVTAASSAQKAPKEKNIEVEGTPHARAVHNALKKVREWRMPHDLLRGGGSHVDFSGAIKVCALALTLAEDLIVCVAQNRQMYKLQLTSPLSTMLSSSNPELGGGLAISAPPPTIAAVDGSSVTTEDKNAQRFEFLQFPFHHGAVVDTSVCLRRPLVASCSTDGSIRIWNFAEYSCELSHYLSSQPLSVSLHPSGNHLIVALKDRVEMFNILIDDLHLLWSQTIEDCRLCEFSQGGQFFAVTSNSRVLIFNSWTQEELLVFDRQKFPITSVSWSPGDWRLTCGSADGTIMTFDAHIQHRPLSRQAPRELEKKLAPSLVEQGDSWDHPGDQVKNLVALRRKQKPSSIRTLDFYPPTVTANKINANAATASVHHDEDPILVLTADGTIDVMNLHTPLTFTPTAPLTCASFVVAENYLIAGTADGEILMLHHPTTRLSAERASVSVGAQHAPVSIGAQHFPASLIQLSTVKVSKDLKHVVSSDVGGNIFIHHIVPNSQKSNATHRTNKKKQSALDAALPATNSTLLLYTDDCLVTKRELLTREGNISDLKNQIAASMHNANHRFQLTTQKHVDTLTSMENKFALELMEVKLPIESLQNDLLSGARDRAEENSQMLQANQLELQQLRLVHEEKLNGEQEMVEKLHAHLATCKHSHLEHVEERRVSRTECEFSLQQAHQLKVHSLDLQVLKIKGEQNLDLTRFQQNLESAVEEETLEIMFEHECLLRKEIDATAIVGLENEKIRSRFSLMQKQIETNKKEIATRIEASKKGQAVVSSLQKDLIGVKHELQERHGSLSDKERRINDLKSKNLELEKFRYVMNAKVDAFHNDVIPREQNATALSNQRLEMGAEEKRLVGHYKQQQTERILLRRKFHAVLKEIEREKGRLVEASKSIDLFRKIFNDLEFNNDEENQRSSAAFRKLKLSVVRLYEYFCLENRGFSAENHPTPINTVASDAICFRLQQSISKDVQLEHINQCNHLQHSLIKMNQNAAMRQTKMQRDNRRLMTENAVILQELNCLRTLPPLFLPSKL